MLEWAVAKSMQSSLLWDRCDYVAALDYSSAAVKQLEKLLEGGGPDRLCKETHPRVALQDLQHPWHLP